MLYFSSYYIKYVENVKALFVVVIRNIDSQNKIIITFGIIIYKYISIKFKVTF